MNFSEVAYLITDAKSTNAIGDPIRTPTETKIYVNELSIRQSEFYQAQASGLRPEIMFETRLQNYNNEGRIKYGGKTYDIIRTYKKNRDFIELVCQGITNGVV